MGRMGDRVVWLVKGGWRRGEARGGVGDVGRGVGAFRKNLDYI